MKGSVINTLRVTSDLLTQQQAFDETDPWRHAATRSLAQRLEDSEFPCIFARNAFKKGLIRIVFVEGTDPDDLVRLADALTDYTALSRDWDGRLDSAYPLVVLFSDATTGHQDIDGFHLFGWRLLHSLHNLDPSPWPEDVASHPALADDATPVPVPERLSGAPQVTRVRWRSCPVRPVWLGFPLRGVIRRMTCHFLGAALPQVVLFVGGPHALGSAGIRVRSGAEVDIPLD